MTQDVLFKKGLTNLNQSIDGKQSLASVDGGNTSIMESSEFSVMKPMQPKLDAAKEGKAAGKKLATKN